MTLAIYFQAIHKKNRIVATLQEKRDSLTKAKESALFENEELRLRMQSQGDLDFLELVLKEKLGVTGEGETKVVFR